MSNFACPCGNWWHAEPNHGTQCLGCGRRYVHYSTGHVWVEDPVVAEVKRLYQAGLGHFRIIHREHGRILRQLLEVRRALGLVKKWKRKGAK